MFLQIREPRTATIKGVLASSTGLIFVQLSDQPDMPTKWTWQVNYHPFPSNVLAKMHRFGFYWQESERVEMSPRTGEVVLYITEVIFPNWLPLLTTALLAIAIRPKPRWRFGLRDLFTLTTVAALVIGPLAFWLRSISVN
jgi:hypothetical protein